MAEEPYKKVGRGGAGNFWSKKDVEDAARLQSMDLEAQKSGLPALTASVSVSTSEYQRTGRGGVGNFVSNPITGSNELPPKNIAVPIIPSEKKIEHRGHSGRGGAGNWRQVAEEEKRQAEEEEQRARNKVDEQVRADVDKGLQPPPRTYGSSAGR